MKNATYGFTLIELLVVIFIIAVIISAASIALGDNQAKRMEQKSQQLAAIVDFAKEQAIFNSEELGMFFTKDAFSFYSLTTDSKDGKEISVWTQIQDDKLLDTRTLPDGLEYELFLDGIKVTPSRKEKITPQVFILSDGSITPFHIKITDNIDHSHTLKVAENGEFEFNAVN